MTSIPKRAYSAAEEWLNSISHGLACVAAIVGLVFMLLRAETSVSVTASAVYGGTLIFMFLSSTIYHAVTHQKAKVGISGNFGVPLTLVAIGGQLGVIATAFIWLLAIAGVAFKMIAKHRFPKVSVFTYLIMGWIVVGLIYPLYQAMPGSGLWLIVAGGLCFSIGVLFYVAKSKKYTHAIWHLFVIGGCSCHYFSIYYYVV